MKKGLSYYGALPYEREWLPRDDESGRYLVVRLKDIPEIYGAGQTRQAALAALRTAFDDQILWCLEEGLEIPEPSIVPVQSERSIGVTMVRITSSTFAPTVRRSGGEQALTQTAKSVESYRSSQPIDVGELQKVA